MNMFTHDQWIALFQPVIGALVLAMAGLITVLLTGLTSKANAWLTAHNQQSLARAVAAADAVIQTSLMTGASTIAGKVARGELDYTNRAALLAEAQREVGLVQARIPDMIAIATPEVTTLVATMLGQIERQLVASPTPLAAQVVATLLPPSTNIAAAASVITDARAALALVDKPNTTQGATA
jgi:hypothetical protein